MGHDAYGGAYISVVPLGHAELGRTPEPRRGRRSSNGTASGSSETSGKAVKRVGRVAWSLARRMTRATGGLMGRTSEGGRIFPPERATERTKIHFRSGARRPLSCQPKSSCPRAT